MRPRPELDSGSRFIIENWGKVQEFFAAFARLERFLGHAATIARQRLVQRLSKAEWRIELQDERNGLQPALHVVAREWESWIDGPRDALIDGLRIAYEDFSIEAFLSDKKDPNLPYGSIVLYSELAYDDVALFEKVRSIVETLPESFAPLALKYAPHLIAVYRFPPLEKTLATDVEAFGTLIEERLWIVIRAVEAIRPQLLKLAPDRVRKRLRRIKDQL